MDHGSSKVSRSSEVGIVVRACMMPRGQACEGRVALASSPTQWLHRCVANPVLLQDPGGHSRHCWALRLDQRCGLLGLWEDTLAGEECRLPL